MNLSGPDPLQNFLQKLTQRSVLNAEEQKAIVDLPGHAVQVQANRDFVRLGDKVDHACLIVTGLVGRFGQNSFGERQITAVHIPGDMADLHSVVAPEASSALQTLSVSTILRVPHSALRDVARRYPAVAEAFWRECVVDAAILSEWLVNLGRRDARARTGHLLCELACRYGAAGTSGTSFHFAATQTHFADMLGLTPVHVNRTFRALRVENLADVKGRTVRILDWSRLASASDFDPVYLQAGEAEEDRLAAAAG